MSYTALYRKYRPAGFDKLIGQEHIVRTLVNQIESGRVGHAYLFTGSRGTGKTSAAKIFARAVNCEKNIKGSPCYKCPTCIALSEQNNLDILEIDAASNNRVDEIRELREKVKYPPISGKYKVYIIDEVHMLTDSAFNALLKTLEEPPSYVIFILATTEVHKLPATILSRCMRFDFRLVPQKDIAAVLEDIFKDIKKPYDKDAVNAIAAAAEGSVRDALSIADMCVSFSDKKLTAADVLAVLGAADTGKQFGLAAAVLGGNAGAVLEIINELISGGKAANILAKDMAGHFRDLLVAKTCGDNTAEILPLPAELIQQYREQAGTAAFDKLYECADALARLDAELRFSVAPRILLEAVCLRLCKGVKSETAAEPAPKPAVQQSQKAAQPADTSGAASVWGKVVTALRNGGSNLLYAAACDKTSVYISGANLVLRLKDAGDFDLFNKPMNTSVISGILEQVTGNREQGTGNGLSFKAEYVPPKEGGGDPFKQVKELGGDAVKFMK